MIEFAVAMVAGPGVEIRVEALVPEPHLVAQFEAPRDRAACGLGAALPIVHVVLLEGARWAEHPHPRHADRFLDLGRGRLVGVDPGPNLGLVRTARMPDAQGARSRPEHRQVRENRADDRLYDVEPRTEAPLHLGPDLGFVGENFGGRRIGHRVGADRDDRMAVPRGQHPPARVRVDPKIAARPDAYGREVTPLHMVSVTGEILRRELPIARHDPFMYATDDLDGAFSAIEKGVEIP